ncbi:Domain of uncharacterised function (DUF404) [Raoultella terrigena]|uniref:Domain of uncharacterized function (DUF404) n=1 Tax=Raoultella terrigena TaxID=577 RepID=A0A4U9CSY4_RAOTE|nr:Domain of uncharacterised function (DUF404) [Raoultella terrigena]
MSPPYGVWAHICGTDLVRDEPGSSTSWKITCGFPPGVSYMLENRAITKRVLPELFERENIKPIDAYPAQLLENPGGPVAPAD